MSSSVGFALTSAMILPLALQWDLLRALMGVGLAVSFLVAVIHSLWRGMRRGWLLEWGSPAQAVLTGARAPFRRVLDPGELQRVCARSGRGDPPPRREVLREVRQLMSIGPLVASLAFGCAAAVLVAQGRRPGEIPRVWPLVSLASLAFLAVLIVALLFRWGEFMQVVTCLLKFTPEGSETVHASAKVAPRPGFAATGTEPLLFDPHRPRHFLLLNALPFTLEMGPGGELRVTGRRWGLARLFAVALLLVAGPIAGVTLTWWLRP